MDPSPKYEGRTTHSRLDGFNEVSKRDNDATLRASDGIPTDTRQNSEVMREILEELRRINTSSMQIASRATAADDSAGNRQKDIGAAYAVVAVFIASIDVGLLTYAHDTFTDRPEGTPAMASDSAINAFWFLSIIFSGIAAMLFAVMQVSSYPVSSSRANTADTSDDVEKGRVDTASTAGTTGREPHTGARSGNPVHRARQRFTELHSAGVTAIVLLMLSLSTLFTGILIFVWSDQTRVVAIVVTVFFGLAWLVPKIPSSVFLSTASLLGL